MKTEWKVYERPDGSFVAAPVEDKTLRRYVLFFPNGTAAWKEVGYPMEFLGNFNSIKDAIKKAMKQ